MSTHSPTDGYLGCFQLCTIIDNAAKNSGVQVFVWVFVFISLGSMPRSRIAGRYREFRFNFLRLPNHFPKRLNPFTFPSTMYEDSHFSASSLHLHCLSRMTNDVVHLLKKVFVSNFYIFFNKMSTKILCYFLLDWIVCHLIIELLESFVYSG